MLNLLVAAFSFATVYECVGKYRRSEKDEACATCLITLISEVPSQMLVTSYTYIVINLHVREIKLPW